VVLRAQVHDADIVQGRRHVGVELPVPAPLALQYGFEQWERVEGVAVLQVMRRECGAFREKRVRRIQVKLQPANETRTLSRRVASSWISGRLFIGSISNCRVYFREAGGSGQLPPSGAIPSS
jgi:hypothetical protein